MYYNYGFWTKFCDENYVIRSGICDFLSVLRGCYGQILSLNASKCQFRDENYVIRSGICDFLSELRGCYGQILFLNASKCKFHDENYVIRSGICDFLSGLRGCYGQIQSLNASKCLKITGHMDLDRAHSPESNEWSHDYVPMLPFGDFSRCC